MPDTRIAIITGAGSGIGRATAVELAAVGWRCAIVGRRSANLAETAALIARRAPGADALTLALDVASPNAAASIVSRTTAQWGGRIDALINNAAVVNPQPIHLASDQALLDTFEINTFAPLRLVRSVWPIMAGRRNGRIVNVSSIATIDPFPGIGVYGMSKCALDGLTRSINTEGRDSGILAFSLVLGPIETEMLRSVVSESALPRSQTKDPAEIAKIILSCATGQRDDDAGRPIIVT